MSASVVPNPLERTQDVYISHRLSFALDLLLHAAAGPRPRLR